MMATKIMAALLLLVTGTNATAQESPASAFTRAANALGGRLGNVETGPLIASTDAAANAADIAVIEQAAAAFATPAFPVEGFNTFESVCEPLNRLSVRHTLDGAAALRRAPDAPPPNAQETAALTAQISALQIRNAARHQNAIVALSTSGLRCTVAHFPVLAQFLAGLPPSELTPVRLNGARQMRLGIARAMIGATAAVRDPSTNPENIQRYLRLLDDIAVPLSNALTPELRTELRNLVAQLPVTGNAGVQASERRLLAALAATDCTQLCLVR